MIKYKGGRHLASFQAAFVCLMRSGWVTFLTFDLLSKHQMPHTGFRAGFITGAAEQIRQTGVTDLRCGTARTLEKSGAGARCEGAPCFIQAGNSHLSSSFRREQKENELEEKIHHHLFPYATAKLQSGALWSPYELSRRLTLSFLWLGVHHMGANLPALWKAKLSSLAVIPGRL